MFTYTYFHQSFLTLQYCDPLKSQNEFVQHHPMIKINDLIGARIDQEITFNNCILIYR